MKYNIGDKVVIIDERTFGMNYSGKMDKYLGDTLTIRKITDIGSYRMEEDYGECDGNGWYWFDNMIDHEKTAELHSKEDEDLFQEIDKTLKSLRENLDDLKSDFQETQENIDNEQPKEVGKSPLEFQDKVEIRIEDVCYGGFQSKVGKVIKKYEMGSLYYVATSMIYGADILLFSRDKLKYIE